MEVNFCRRCGQPLTQTGEGEYKCSAGHNLFYKGSPSIGLFLVTDNNQVLLVTRGRDPDAGKLDSPGGFCDLHESLEATIVREVREELGIEPSSYGPPQYFFSGSNTYNYQGETLYPLDTFFWARAKSNLHVTAGDDAAEADWYDLATLDITNRVAFVTVQAALRKLKTLVL